MRIAIVSGVDIDVIRHLEKHHEVIYNLDAKPDVLRNTIQGCDVLVFRSGVSITAELMAHAPNLGLLVRAGSGLDNIDLEYLKLRDIKLQRIPEPSAQAVGEMAIALMFALARKPTRSCVRVTGRSLNLRVIFSPAKSWELWAPATLEPEPVSWARHWE